jgi:hypothetical protein
LVVTSSPWRQALALCVVDGHRIIAQAKTTQKIHASWRK